VLRLRWPGPANAECPAAVWLAGHSGELCELVVAVAGAGVAVVAAEAVEQAAHGPGAGLGDAAQDARQRVLGAVPGVLVGLGGVAHLVGELRVAVVVPARVVPAEDPVVLAVG